MPQAAKSTAAKAERTGGSSSAGQKVKAAKAGPPNQMQLARKASSSKRKKTSRKIKRGVTSDRTVSVVGTDQGSNPGTVEPVTGSKTALADRLKRWLSGNKDE